MYRHFLVFRDYAEKLGLDAEFREVEGYNHEWRFWELEIQRVMDVFLPSDKRAGNAF